METKESLAFLSSIDKNYADVSVLVSEKIDDTPVVLIFGSYVYQEITDEKPLNKTDHIFETDLPQREYLMRTFTEEKKKEWFRSHDGSYELFYPISTGKNTIILYFQDQQRYGKIGS